MNDETILRPDASAAPRDDLDDWIFRGESWMISDR